LAYIVYDNWVASSVLREKSRHFLVDLLHHIVHEYVPGLWDDVAREPAVDLVDEIELAPAVRVRTAQA